MRVLAASFALLASLAFDYPYHKRHLVLARYWERSQWLLVAANGKQTDLWGPPVISPDSSKIVATCQGIEYGGGQPNIIQVLAMRNGQLRLVWEYEPKTWEPTDADWLTGNTFVIGKVTWTEKNPGHTRTYAQAKVKL